jgi:hypothetical protein
LRGNSRRDRSRVAGRVSWRSSITLLRVAPALVGFGVVLRGTAPTVLMRATLASISGEIQSIKKAPTVLWLSSARLLGETPDPSSLRCADAARNACGDSTVLSARPGSIDGQA